MKEHKLAAIVFTDIVGYTKRMEADEEGTMKLLEKQREIIFPLVKEYDGEIIKEIGDGLMMMFNSANRAVRFAIAIQERLKEEELTIRAGIHIGDVIFESGDVFGSAVNIAARIEPLARPGGICISEDVRSQIRNQGDIVTVSIGRKELKGVAVPIEIFNVFTGEQMEEQPKIPFFKDLWKRRVIQITGIYLVLSFLMRLGTEMIVRKYMLSPHLVNLVWFMLISLIPSIILISYFHGRKGVSRWTKIELVGLPVNIIAAFIVLFLLFKGKEMGAITTTLKIQDEDGKEVERLVLKNEFRKKILIFNLNNITGDTALDYLQYGIPEMLQQDLMQDLLLNAETIRKIFPQIIESGHKDGTGLSLTLMKRFADQMHKNYFIFGDFSREGADYILKLKLYETELTRFVSDIEVRDPSPFGLVDKLTPVLKKDLELPESQISLWPDLPVSEIFTSSEKALYYFSRAIVEEAESKWTKTNNSLERAIAEDNDFAIAHLYAALSFLNTGDVDKANLHLQSAINLLDKLSDRQKFVAKYVYYVLGQEPEKALAVLKMWIELYPDDMVAHESLAQRYAVKNMVKEALAEYKEILRLDPERYEVMSTLGGFYLRLGEYDSSLVYYEKYASALPKQTESYRNLGRYYRTTGNMEMAGEYYQKALLMADMSEMASIKIDLANIALLSGDFEKALQGYSDALNDSRNSEDSGQVYQALYSYYHIRGQADKALEYYEKKLEKFKTYVAPRDYIVFQVFNMEVYVDAGETEKALRILDDLSARLSPPLHNIVPIGYMFLYAETGDIEKAQEAMEGAEELAKGFGEEVMMNNIYYAQAKISELQGNYADAIQNYNKYLSSNANNYTVYIGIARCYRLMKEYAKAEEEILIPLKYRPFIPEVNYEAALIYFDLGEKEKGMELLERTVDIWQDADEDYSKARQAKQKL
ncbi:MAG TPA: tetratricopeptide repeat protein, partial [Bacteroidales bacterium]|nr:tetratricopeptide repeat protein [Bacteroidales bacterium]